MRHRATRTTLEALAFGLVALAVGLKLLLAPGLMPGVDRLGQPALVLCASQGLEALHHDEAPGEARQACPFEGQAAVVPVEPPAPWLVAAVDYPAEVIAAPSEGTPGLGLSAPPPPSRGPPLPRA